MMSDHAITHRNTTPDVVYSVLIIVNRTGVDYSNMETGNELAQKYSEADRREEDKRIRYLRRLVDFSLAHIAQSRISIDEAHRVVDAVRMKAIDMFPGKEATFDLIYTPRFRRLITEKFGLN